MPKVLEELSADHRNFARLFDLLGRELAAFKAGGRPDYDLVERILDYCLNYPDLCHHPKEDLIFEMLQARDPAVAKIIGNLHREHERLAALTRRFAAAVRNVLEDELLPRDWFMDVANDFLNFSRNHMQMEEVLFYPAARKTLTDEDWAALNAAAEAVEDPLFGDKKSEKYRGLYKEIMEWGEAAEESV